MRRQHPGTGWLGANVSRLPNGSHRGNLSSCYERSVSSHVEGVLCHHPPNLDAKLGGSKKKRKEKEDRKGVETQHAWYYKIQDMVVDHYATSLLCDKNRGPTRAADGGDASAKKLARQGKVITPRKTPRACHCLSVKRTP